MIFLKSIVFLSIATFCFAEVELGTINVEGQAPQQHQELQERKKQSTSKLAKETNGETLGDFLEKEQFVDTANYGPAVGRPVIRGMDGYRVGILQGNILLNDLSAMSQDHAVGLMARNSQKIELIKGPSSLLYGNNSGGVIRVEGEEHISTLMDTGLHIQTNGAYGTNGAGYLGAGNIGYSDYNFSVFGSSTYYDAQEYETYNGLLVSDSDSQMAQNHLTLGWQIDKYNIIKPYIDLLEKDYGIPNDNGHTTRINMHQQRYGVVWHVKKAFGIFKDIQNEVQVSNYLHQETDNGSPDGLFGQDQESVSSLFHFNGDSWEHAMHVQYMHSYIQICHEHGKCNSFSDAERTAAEDGASLADYVKNTGLPYSHGHPMANVDENNFIVAYDTDRYFDEDELSFSLRANGRLMNVDPSNMQEPWLVNESVDPNYYGNKNAVALSTSVGWFSYIGDSMSLQTSLSYIERLPSASEMYWNGFHHATDTYIFGNPYLKKEQSINFDIEYLWTYDPFSTVVSGFYYDFFNYIFQRPVNDPFGNAQLDPFHGTPVWIMSEVGAVVSGISVMQRYSDTIESNTFDFDISLEAIRGVQKSGQNLPRMPPFNATFIFRHTYEGLMTTIDYKLVDKSRFIFDDETETPGYQWLNAKVEYYGTFDKFQYTAYVKGVNLTNAQARNHLSFIKDTAPLPGTQFMTGVELKYN